MAGIGGTLGSTREKAGDPPKATAKAPTAGASERQSAAVSRGLADCDPNSLSVRYDPQISPTADLGRAGPSRPGNRSALLTARSLERRMASGSKSQNGGH